MAYNPRQPFPAFPSEVLPMKAAVYHRYGPPEVIAIEDVEKPTPKGGEVLIRVRAAALNPLDWHIVRGKPYIMRLMGGWRAPRATRLGVDVAGEVEATGAGVTAFKPGDAVFGDVFGPVRGAFAEYVCATQTKVVAKPAALTFEQAASVPVAAFTALQALRDKGRVQPGQRVLINGAAGGVGTFAVQIAKSFGAHVTAVCSAKNAVLVQLLGADEVIDYGREDFTAGSRRFDLIIDAAGNRPLTALRHALVPKGTCVIMTGPNGRWLGPLSSFVAALALSPFVSQKFVPLVARPNQDDLQIICGLMQSGKVVPVIDRCYPLNQVADALAYLEQGHASGKVVVKMPE
jgi:NADPH:quinone reductase-like Zn-dependent oxidoreductase